MLAATNRLLIAQGPFAGDAQAKLLGGGPALLDDALGHGIGAQVAECSVGVEAAVRIEELSSDCLGPFWVLGRVVGLVDTEPTPDRSGDHDEGGDSDGSGNPGERPALRPGAGQLLSDHGSTLGGRRRAWHRRGPATVMRASTYRRIGASTFAALGRARGRC
jgi:hypothetical protein